MIAFALRILFTFFAAAWIGAISNFVCFLLVAVLLTGLDLSRLVQDYLSAFNGWLFWGISAGIAIGIFPYLRRMRFGRGDTRFDRL